MRNTNKEIKMTTIEELTLRTDIMNKTYEMKIAKEIEAKRIEDFRANQPKQNRKFTYRPSGKL